jgi:hypothetical protein
MSTDNKHHKAALSFLWEFWKLACIGVGTAAGALGCFVTLCFAIDITPIPLRIAAGLVLAVGALYWIGYSLSKEQEAVSDRNYERNCERYEEANPTDDFA